MKKPKTNPNYMTNHQNIAINRGFSGSITFFVGFLDKPILNRRFQGDLKPKAVA